MLMSWSPRRFSPYGLVTAHAGQTYLNEATGEMAMRNSQDKTERS